jgi:hypothetical protein
MHCSKGLRKKGTLLHLLLYKYSGCCVPTSIKLDHQAQVMVQCETGCGTQRKLAKSATPVSAYVKGSWE